MQSRIVPAILVLAVVAGGIAQEKKAKTPKTKARKAAKPDDRPIDPLGKPDTALAARLGAKTARYYLWFDAGAWHLRTTANQLRHFHGTIRVTGGRIASCVSVGLRRDTKGKVVQDSWRVNKARDELTFDFKTARASDGFDLKVEGESAELEFVLAIGTETRPRAVFIGRDQQRPAEIPFSLKTPSDAERKR